MKTLKEDLQECLTEMQATAKKFEELMNTPGIEWPELEYNHNDYVFTKGGFCSLCDLLGDDNTCLVVGSKNFDCSNGHFKRIK